MTLHIDTCGIKQFSNTIVGNVFEHLTVGIRKRFCCVLGIFYLPKMSPIWYWVCSVSIAVGLPSFDASLGGPISLNMAVPTWRHICCLHQWTLSFEPTQVCVVLIKSFSLLPSLLHVVGWCFQEWEDGWWCIGSECRMWVTLMTILIHASCALLCSPVTNVR